MLTWGVPGAHAALGVWAMLPAGGGRGPGILGGGGMSAAAVRADAPERRGAGTQGTSSVLRKKRSTAATASSSRACMAAPHGASREVGIHPKNAHLCARIDRTLLPKLSAKKDVQV